MATCAIYGSYTLFWGVMLISALFTPISGNKDRHQARFKRADELVESIQAKKYRPDIAIMEEKTVMTPLKPYMPRAVEEYDDQMSTMLTDFRPPNEMLVWKRRKMWPPSQFEEIPSKKRRLYVFSKPRFETSQGGISRKLNRRNSWRRVLQRLTRSLSGLHGRENNLEKMFGNNYLKTQAQKRSRKAKLVRKRRDTEITLTPITNTHLQLSALKTQMKLSEIVEQLANPSVPLTEAEKLAYMRELLQELKLFIKLLQEQIQVELKAKNLARASPSFQ